MPNYFQLSLDDFGPAIKNFAEMISMESMESLKNTNFSYFEN